MHYQHRKLAACFLALKAFLLPCRQDLVNKVEGLSPGGKVIDFICSSARGLCMRPVTFSHTRNGRTRHTSGKTSQGRRSAATRIPEILPSAVIPGAMSSEYY